MNTATMIAGFKPMLGVHCETVATGSLLKAAGIELSEAMLFGLGEGLSFVFLNLASLPLPFVGGRVKPFELTERLCRQLGITLHAAETSSKSKAWSALEAAIEADKPVGLQLDAYHLNYFSIPFHFAGHCVAVYGFDSEKLWVVDTVQQGSLHQVARPRIEAARFEKGPMSARARAWTVERNGQGIALADALRAAMRANAAAYLAPTFQGASYLGIRKLAASLPKWQQISSNPESDLAQAALLMERAGTGGSVFRNFYRDFLVEAGPHLSDERDLIAEAAALFTASAQAWGCVARLIESAGAKPSNDAPLREASTTCLRIAELEVSAMQLLARL